MSNMVLFFIEDDMDYEKMKHLSKKIIRYCLKKDVGVVFNFLGYGQDLIESIDPKFYFSVSDDFIQLNSEFLTTSDIRSIENDYGKKIFVERFSLFDDIYEILCDSNIKKSKLLISADGSTNSLEEFIVKKIANGSIAETLYESVIEKKDEYAYDFPNILLDLSAHRK